MEYLPFYRDRLGCQNNDEVFGYIISTLKPSNKLWSYFVNWGKVLTNTREIEISLNILNYLIGKENFDDEFRNLLRKHPQVIQVIPALVVREGKKRGETEEVLHILVDYSNRRLRYAEIDFGKTEITDEDIEKYLTFVEKTGVKARMQSREIKNLVDYMIGVEAGLDSNARKNRGGAVMEDIVEPFIEDVCNRVGGRYIRQANAKKIRQIFGYDVPVDRSSRKYDFAIDYKERLFLVETNFYGGVGSKLKSTAGEYRNLFDVLSGKYNFIWITDGKGWKTTQRPLRETFEHNDYLVNLNMLEHGVLAAILKTAG